MNSDEQYKRLGHAIAIILIIVIVILLWSITHYSPEDCVDPNQLIFTN